MDIEGVAEIFSTHRRALDMPARSARTPGAVPGRFARLRPLPQDEVHRVSFLLVDRNPRPGLHVVEVAVGELAVPGKAVDRIIDVVARLVGHALGDQFGDEADHLGDVLGGLRFQVGSVDAESVHVDIELVDEAIGEFCGGGVLFGRPVDDLVVDVGEVADIGHPQAAIAEIADDHVEGEGGAGVSYMAVVVRGDAAHIELDMSRFERLERLFLPG